MRKMHVNEYHAYHDLMPTAGLNVPDCLCAAMDDDGRALVILEDLCLRDVRLPSLKQPNDFDIARGLLAGLPTLHARTWEAPELHRPFAWVTGAGETGNATGWTKRGDAAGSPVVTSILKKKIT